MKKILFFFILAFAFSCSDDSFTIEGNNEVPDDLQNVDWALNFGGTGDDSPRSIIQTNDGGFAILGITNSTDGDLSFKTLSVNDTSVKVC